MDWTVSQIALFLHVFLGFTALFSAFVAIFTKVWNISHTWHVYSGRIFYYAMLGVFLTSLLLTWLRPNLFLTLIAVFSFYLAYSGLRQAVNRDGKPKFADYAKSWIMFLVSIGMLIFAVISFMDGFGQGLVLAIFGAIGFGLSTGDLIRLRGKPVKGKDRISAHLGMMMGATIATITAFLVTNFQLQPPWLLWILPTIFITPLITLLNRKLYKGRYF